MAYKLLNNNNFPRTDVTLACGQELEMYTSCRGAFWQHPVERSTSTQGCSMNLRRNILCGIVWLQSATLAVRCSRGQFFMENCGHCQCSLWWRCGITIKIQPLSIRHCEILKKINSNVDVETSKARFELLQIWIFISVIT